jgi:hypothetical protein
MRCDDEGMQPSEQPMCRCKCVMERRRKNHPQNRVPRVGSSQHTPHHTVSGFLPVGNLPMYCTLPLKPSTSNLCPTFQLCHAILQILPCFELRRRPAITRTRFLGHASHLGVMFRFFVYQINPSAHASRAAPALQRVRSEMCQLHHCRDH